MGCSAYGEAVNLLDEKSTEQTENRNVSGPQAFLPHVVENFPENIQHEEYN